MYVLTESAHSDDCYWNACQTVRECKYFAMWHHHINEWVKMGLRVCRFSMICRDEWLTVRNCAEIISCVDKCCKFHTMLRVTIVKNNALATDFLQPFLSFHFITQPPSPSLYSESEFSFFFFLFFSLVDGN